ESPRRGETFVTRKITRAAVRILLGMQRVLYLGNLDSRRDWGHAKDYVEAMWLILQHDSPNDYVVATGRTSSIRDFLKLAFGDLGIEICFRGQGADEVGFVGSVDAGRLRELAGEVNLKAGDVVVRVDRRYFRPTEVDILQGDASKAKERLGWQAKTTLEELVSEMVASDLCEAKKEKLLIRNDYFVRENYGE
ncbi:GDP-mannose 4,6-dehydratase, partial [bacterium]|nr:GDP-mannose 4,6-dehydratase [bacterium]